METEEAAEAKGVPVCVGSGTEQTPFTRDPHSAANQKGGRERERGDTERERGDRERAERERLSEREIERERDSWSQNAQTVVADVAVLVMFSKRLIEHYRCDREAG